MCGRFTLTVDPAELREAFANYTFPAQFAPRYNIAPTQPVLAIPNDAKNTADFHLWGLIPSWSKDPSIANKLINARGETIAIIDSREVAEAKSEYLAALANFDLDRKSVV